MGSKESLGKRTAPEVATRGVLWPHGRLALGDGALYPHGGLVGKVDLKSYHASLALAQHHEQQRSRNNAVGSIVSKGRGTLEEFDLLHS